MDLPSRVPRLLQRFDDAGCDALLVTLMARDKKAVDGLTFVLDGPRGVEVVAGVPADAVEATLAEATAG